MLAAPATEPQWPTIFQKQSLSSVKDIMQEGIARQVLLNSHSTDLPESANTHDFAVNKGRMKN